MKKAVKFFIKKSLGAVFRKTALVRQTLDRGTTIFVFHEVSDNPSEFARDYDLYVSPRLFRHQVSWIKENFNVIHPADLLLTRTLPERAAIITFDDGFLGTFQNGLPILEDLGLPSIIFVNMAAVVKRKPIFSALSCYLENRVPKYLEFCNDHGISSPCHLRVTPKLFSAFLGKNRNFNNAEALHYQGPFANLEVLNYWDRKGVVVYGNHFFDHWNARALNESEIQTEYEKNVEYLWRFKSYLNFFAFTNGQPGSCYLQQHVAQISHLGAAKIFSGRGGVNLDPKLQLLGRLSLSSRDVDADHLWFRVGCAALTALKADL
jgi:hypothetical protein